MSVSFPKHFRYNSFSYSQPGILMSCEMHFWSQKPDTFEPVCNTEEVLLIKLDTQQKHT